jgi:HEAT repeat protein
LGKLGNGSQTVIDALVARTEDEKSSVRISAADALGNLGVREALRMQHRSQTVIGVLLAGLSDGESSARISAANILGKLGKTSTDVVAAVVRWIEQHQDSEYLGNVIDALWDAVVEEES